MRDLCGISFDPRLKLEKNPCTEPPKPGADLVAKRKVLGDVDVYALFYPFRFNSPEAMLKGYVERMFGMGFSYADGPGAMEPLMQGKK